MALPRLTMARVELQGFLETLKVTRRVSSGELTIDQLMEHLYNALDRRANVTAWRSRTFGHLRSIKSEPTGSFFYWGFPGSAQQCPQLGQESMHHAPSTAMVSTTYCLNAPRGIATPAISSSLPIRPAKHC